MLEGLENFLSKHHNAVAALEAVSTFAAVVTSLVLAGLARRSNRTRISASANISVILHSSLEGRPKPKFVTVNIMNIGTLPATIPFSFFHWRVPFKRGIFIVNPMDYYRASEWVPQRSYPAEIKPRASQSFFLQDIDTLRQEYARHFRPRSLSDRWRFKRIRARVVTEDDRIFKVRIGKSLREELRALAAGASRGTETTTTAPREHT